MGGGTDRVVYNIISMDWVHLILTDSVYESPSDTTHWNEQSRVKVN